LQFLTRLLPPTNQGHCATEPEQLCAEFVSHALNAGGMFPGVYDYGNYNGYNLRLVSGLHA
jgi:hypothetical protein